MNITGRGIITGLLILFICGLVVLSGFLAMKNDSITKEKGLLQNQLDQLSIQEKKLENELAKLRTEVKQLKVNVPPVIRKQDPVLFSGKLRLGERFPHFRAKDIDGNTVDTQSFSGRVLLLHFSFYNVTSNIEQLKHIVNLYGKYHENGLIVLNIDVASHSSLEAKRFIESIGVSIPYSTIVDDDHALLSHLDVNMLPATLLVDPSGVLRLKRVGWFPKVTQELDEWLQLHFRKR